MQTRIRHWQNDFSKKLLNMLIADIYNPNIFPIQENVSVKEALEILRNKHYNGVLVVNHHGDLSGVLSLQDIAAAIVPIDMKLHTSLAHALYKPNFFRDMCQEIKDIPVKKIMRKDFITVTLETSAMEIAADFLKNDLYIVPVIEKGKPVGIVTRSEIKTALAKGMGLD